MKDLIKDKLLVWFYVGLVILFGILYYVGEGRTRKFEEEGFTLCKYKGAEMWQKQCQEQIGFIDKLKRELR